MNNRSRRLSMNPIKQGRRRIATWLISAICVMTLSGCVTRYVVAPIEPRLTEHIADPDIEGRTWNDVYVQSIRRSEVIRRYQCRDYVLRKEPLPEECK